MPTCSRDQACCNNLSPYAWTRSPICLLQCLCAMELVTFDGPPYLWACRPQESHAESWAPASNSHSDLAAWAAEVVVLLIPASSLESFCLEAHSPPSSSCLYLSSPTPRVAGAEAARSNTVCGRLSATPHTLQ